MLLLTPKRHPALLDRRVNEAEAPSAGDEVIVIDDDDPSGAKAVAPVAPSTLTGCEVIVIDDDPPGTKALAPMVERIISDAAEAVPEEQNFSVVTESSSAFLPQVMGKRQTTIAQAVRIILSAPSMTSVTPCNPVCPVPNQASAPLIPAAPDGKQTSSARHRKQKRAARKKTGKAPLKGMVAKTKKKKKKQKEVKPKNPTAAKLAAAAAPGNEPGERPKTARQVALEASKLQKKEQVQVDQVLSAFLVTAAQQPGHFQQRPESEKPEGECNY